MNENKTFKYFLLIFIAAIFAKKIKSDFILREIGHLKLINPLELIYKDNTWQQQNNRYESNVSSFNQQAKKLLRLIAQNYNKKSTKSSRNQNNLSFNNIVNTSDSKNEKFLTTEMSSINIEPSYSTSRVNSIKRINYDMQDKTSLSEMELTTKPNLVNSKRKFQKINHLKNENENMRIESTLNPSYKCINCVDIKGSFECKRFEENELREIINLFCCECSFSEE
jgi:hypothetical protein